MIQRHRKFSAVSLLRMLVLTLLRKPAAKPTDFQATAAQLGLEVTAAAVEHRFNGRLVVFLPPARSWSGSWSGRWPRRPTHRVAQEVHQRPARRQQHPRAASGTGRPSSPAAAAPCTPDQQRSKIHLLWDFLTGSILRLGITPGRDSDATNPIARELPPAGSLSLFDLGYFALDRLGNITRAGAFSISSCSSGTSVFDAQGQPWRCCNTSGGSPDPDRCDGPVLLGVADRLPCRLVALRVPQEVADRRRQNASRRPRSMAQRHRRGSISTGRTGRSS